MNYKWSILTEEEYQSFAEKNSQANFLNAINAAERWKQRGWKTEYIGVKEENTIVSASLLVSIPRGGFGRYYYCPRGFLMDYKNTELVKYTIEQTKKYLKENQGLYWKIDPYYEYQKHLYTGEVIHGTTCDDVLEILKDCGFIHHGLTKGYDPSVQCRWMSVIPLKGKTEESLLASFDQRTRRMIRKNIKNQVRVREVKEEELDTFVEILHQTGERQHFSDMDKSYYINMKKCYGDHFRLMLAEMPDPESGNYRPLSAASFVFYGNEVIYLSGGTFTDCMKYNAMYMIQWKMICQALQQNYACYNFYGISGYFEKGEEGYGVYEFKRGFRADVIELIGDFIMPIRPFRYKIFELAHRIRSNRND